MRGVGMTEAGRICSESLNSARRGAAHEEWAARRLRGAPGDPDAAEWLGALWPGESPRSVLVERVGQAGEKCDLLARACLEGSRGERRMRLGRWSAKMASAEGDRGWSHLQRISPAKARALGLRAGSRGERALMAWCEGQTRLEAAQKADLLAIVESLEPAWDGWVAGMLFGEGELAADGLICTKARPENGWIVAARTVAIARGAALDLALALGGAPRYSPAWGGSLSDGFVSVRASGRGCEGLQAKFDMAALMAAASGCGGD